MVVEGGEVVTEEDSDDLSREVRLLKAFKKDKFDDKLEIYLNNVCSGYKKMKGSKEVDSIDKVWTPILLSEEFPILNIVLRSTHSIFHSTASVEQLTQLEIFWVIDLIV